MIIVFDLDGNYIMSCQPVPASHSGDDYIQAPIEKDVSYDSQYAYSLVDGVAVRGGIIPIDVDEEKRIEDEYRAIEYQHKRRYPPIGDQLDALFHSGAFPKEMADKIQAAKDANPKPI